MKHFLLYTNTYKDKELQITERVRRYLEDNNQKVTITVGEADWKQREESVRSTLGYIDCIIVLGGDGTVLEAARATRNLKAPMITVNLGTLGYMTQVEPDDLEISLKKLIQDEFITESRMQIKGTITKKDGSVKEGWALNDIVITRGGSLQLLRFNIYVNGMFLGDYQADGFIVTTPTGSTGYSLSAGGPIVEPAAKLIMLTPICPHTLNQRSIILSADDCVEIQIPVGRAGQDQHMEVSFDGVSTTINTDEKITIVKAEKSVDFILLKRESFLEILHRKMNEN